MTERLTRALRPLLLLLLVAGMCRAQENQPPQGKPLFTADAYIAHVRYLASDELTGRLPGTPGGRAAGEYIAEQFKKLGLKPAGADDTYFQPFTVRRLKNLHAERAAFEVSGLNRKWVIRKDWIPMPFSRPGQIEGPLAFAGYGIEAPDHGYNDYADFDADGKVLLILRYEPKADDPEADFGGDTPSRHALFVKKARVAAEKGAKALLIVNPPNRDPDRDELYHWHIWNTQRSYALPLVHISRELAGAILKQARMPDLKTLQEKLDQQHKTLSADLKGVSVRIDTGVEYVQGRNVISLLPGDGSTDEIIVVGAHYDHDGEVPERNGKLEIHNGADDNASGTAGVLEMARVFAAGPQPRRNILFMTFDAEERGLLGSKYFVEHPTVDLGKVRAMINFDMIGRLRLDKFTIWGTGSAREFPELVRSAAAGLELSYRAQATASMKFGASDHFSFYRKNIPVLFPFTGMHKHYNTPEDDWQRIDAEGAAKILQMMHSVLNVLANMQDGPTFVGKEDEEKLLEQRDPNAVPAARKSADRKEKVTGGHGRREGLTVRLGIMPDFAADQSVGLRVEVVVDNGPAAKGGMQDGDVILRIADQPIADIYEYMEVLKKFKPGDEVEVAVRRADKQVTLKIKLEASQGPAKPKDN